MQCVLGIWAVEELEPLVLEGEAELVPLDVAVVGIAAFGGDEEEDEMLFVLAAHTAAAKRCTSTVPLEVACRWSAWKAAYNETAVR